VLLILDLLRFPHQQDHLLTHTQAAEAGCQGGPGREAENLTGVLEATVRDPSKVKAPAPD
jgi:hypothetical protein